MGYESGLLTERILHARDVVPQMRTVWHDTILSDTLYLACAAPFLEHLKHSRGVAWRHLSCSDIAHLIVSNLLHKPHRHPSIWERCVRCSYASGSGVHNLYDVKLFAKKVPLPRVTLLGNILLRSIVVSVLIRLINGYSVTDGTWLNLFLKIGGSVLLVDALHVVLGIAPSPCDDSPKGHPNTSPPPNTLN